MWMHTQAVDASLLNSVRRGGGQQPLDVFEPCILGSMSKFDDSVNCCTSMLVIEELKKQGLKSVIAYHVPSTRLRVATFAPKPALLKASQTPSRVGR